MALEGVLEQLQDNLFRDDVARAGLPLDVRHEHQEAAREVVVELRPAGAEAAAVALLQVCRAFGGAKALELPVRRKNRDGRHFGVISNLGARVAQALEEDARSDRDVGELVQPGRVVAKEWRLGALGLLLGVPSAATKLLHLGWDDGGRPCCCCEQLGHAPYLARPLGDLRLGCDL